MTATDAPNPDDGFRTESHDSILVEFTDADADRTPRPVREVVLRHLPGWLRGATGRPDPSPRDPGSLADCLLAQGRVLLALGRNAEAVPKLAEAERCYREAGIVAGVADCFHVVAKVYEALGDPDRALDYLRREEDLRRRPAA